MEGGIDNKYNVPLKLWKSIDKAMYNHMMDILLSGQAVYRPTGAPEYSSAQWHILVHNTAVVAAMK